MLGGMRFTFPERHPLWWTTICFVVWGFPQWLSATWSLVSDKPLADVIRPHLKSMSVPDISPYWITAPAGAVMFLWLIYELRASRNYKYKGQEKISHSLHATSLNFDKQMDFVHSVVERQCNREGTTVEGEKKGTSPYIDPDWEMSTLVEYLKDSLPACEGLSTDDYDRERIDMALGEIRKQGCLGNIQLYGSAQYNGPPVEIPKNYWKEGQLQASLLTTKVGKENEVTEYFVSGRSRGPQESYSDIRVSSIDAMHLWPVVHIV